MAFYGNEEFRESENSRPGTGIAVKNLYSDSPFPALLYRTIEDVIPNDDDGKQARIRNMIQGHAMETLMVHNAVESDLAIAEGWHSTVAAAIALSDVADEVDMARRGPGRPRKDV